MLHDGNSKDNDRRVLEGELLFLQVLLNSDDGRATLSEATPEKYRQEPFKDGGKWRGCIPKRLAGRGIIGALGAEDGRLESHRSTRAARRSGIAVVWKLINAKAARQRLGALTKLLGKQSPPRQRGLFDDCPDEID